MHIGQPFDKLREQQPQRGANETTYTRYLNPTCDAVNPSRS